MDRLVGKIGALFGATDTLLDRAGGYGAPWLGRNPEATRAAKRQVVRALRRDTRCAIAEGLAEIEEERAVHGGQDVQCPGCEWCGAIDTEDWSHVAYQGAGVQVVHLCACGLSTCTGLRIRERAERPWLTIEGGPVVLPPPVRDEVGGLYAGIYAEPLDFS